MNDENEVRRVQIMEQKLVALDGTEIVVSGWGYGKSSLIMNKEGDVVKYDIIPRYE